MFACVHNAGARERCLDELVRLGRGFTPLVEETSPATVVLDISGCERLFGSPRSLAGEIAHRASRAELNANVAVASNPDVAVCAAIGLAGVNVISRGKEAAVLKSLPVELFRQTAISPQKLSRVTPAPRADATKPGAKSLVEDDRESLRQLEEILETLELWGIRTFGDLAALPEAGLSERLGPLGVRLRKLARGECRRPLLLEKQNTQFQKSLELDDPVELLEPLTFILSGLFEALCIDLKSQALAANEIKLLMKLEDRSWYERVIRLPFPMRSSKVFVRLLAHDIELDPPQVAIISIAVSAEPVEPRGLQHGLFQPLAPEPEKLELTLIRLMKLVGPENVGSPELLDTHRPDAFRMRRFVVRGKAMGRPRVSASPFAASPRPRVPSPPLVLAFRVFRPPLPAEVEHQAGRPDRIIRADSETQSRVIRGRVCKAVGPWRTSGGWWRSDSWSRDEWDVVIAETGALYRIYQDLQTGEWFVEGMYD
jgi:protein ImuB